MSVREAEKLVTRARGRAGAGAKPRARRKSRATSSRLEEELSDTLATPVAIKMGAKNKGQLIIDFADLDALDDLIGKLRA